MLSIYVAAAFVGVVFAILTGVLGLFEGHGPDVDAGGGIHLSDLDHPHGPDLGALPFLSLRFWTYFCAGFGLSGIALTLTKSASSSVTLTASLLFGIVTGMAVFSLMRFAKKHQSGELAGEKELLGLQGKMLVATDGKNPGKLRVTCNGELIDFLALSEDGAPIPTGATALILSVENTTVRVQNVTPILEQELK